MLRKLGKYEILDEIGHGGMATVYRARDTRLDRLVALKVMHPHLRAAPEARVRFTREARSVAKLRHPNILEIYDNSEEDEDEAYIVTELLTGPTLKAFAEQHQDLPAEIAACFTIEIARALDAAHAAGIVHRDVKPENVLLHEDRCAKLTDFGIAQMVDSQSFTATGQILGSPGHMAPEQVEGGDCDHRTDLFSLGTVLYYLATGRLPFAGKNPHQVLKRIVDVDYADPLRVRPSIGGRLRAIIARALARDPNHRYQTAKELEEELSAFVGEAGIDDPSAMLARYLRDPEKVSAELREDIVRRLVARGRKASSAGDVPAALDDFNRVLALDEGNPQVLELIERIGRRSRQRMTLTIAGAVLGVFGLGAMGYALFGDRGDDIPVVVAEGPAADAAMGAGADAGLAAAMPDASAVARAAERDAGREDGPELVGRPRQRVEAVRLPSGPRRVVFRIQPCQDVSIGVDGQDPRPFGPSFRAVELEPGPHRFSFRDSSACADEDLTVQIPGGAGDYVLAQHLSFQPAGLYVRSNVAAEVSVNGGAVTGHSHEILYVPMQRPQATARIAVTAEDHRAYTGVVRLTAGQPTEARVDLPASGSAP